MKLSQNFRVDIGSLPIYLMWMSIPSSFQDLFVYPPYKGICENLLCHMMWLWCCQNDYDVLWSLPYIILTLWLWLRRCEFLTEITVDGVKSHEVQVQVDSDLCPKYSCPKHRIRKIKFWNRSPNRVLSVNYIQTTYFLFKS